MKRLIPRALVVLTVLVVLGAGGYAGQVWWAKRLVIGACRRLDRSSISYIDYSVTMANWRSTPVWGKWNSYVLLISHGDGDEGSADMLKGWMPRRTYYELFRFLTTQDLGNDPNAWEAWFKTHPDLTWDAKLKRLVEPKP